MTGLTIWANSIDEETVILQYNKIDEKGKITTVSEPIIKINYEDMSIKNCKTNTVCVFYHPVQFEYITEKIKQYVIKQRISKLDKLIRIHIGSIFALSKEEQLKEAIGFFMWMKCNRMTNTGTYYRMLLKLFRKYGVTYDFRYKELRELLKNQGLYYAYIYRLEYVFRLYKQFKSDTLTDELQNIIAFAVYLKQTKKSETLFKNYTTHIINAYRWGKLNDINGLEELLKGRGYCVKTIRNYKTALNSYYDFLKKYDMVIQ